MTRTRIYDMRTIREAVRVVIENSQRDDGPVYYRHRPDASDAFRPNRSRKVSWKKVGF